MSSGEISTSTDFDMTANNTIVAEYAKKVASLMRLVTDLRAIGAQVDLDLPGISVIGNQSAGKSSLIEAISGISLPRSAGTCTRCPMECRLTFADNPWKCQVLIRKEQDEYGVQLTEIKEELFGDVIFDKSLLEDRIRKAQLAILNPDIPSSEFVNMTGAAANVAKSQLQFSYNVVCIDISGPELTNLTFVDLPGIIGSVGDGEDRKNIDLVKDLVKHYIASNCLILLTLTMRDELHNQTARELAMNVDPLGLRTIGVLTKPDTLQAGEEKTWLKVIEGKDWRLRFGYYMTKQPALSDLERKIDHSEARKAETTFFLTTEPWRSVSSTVRNRLGVPNLTTKLSETLSTLIEKELPSLRSKSKELLQNVNTELSNLPPPPSDNPTAELLRLVTAFNSRAGEYIQGLENREDLLQKCRPAYERFKNDIKRTIPIFRCQEEETDEEETDEQSGFEIASEDDSDASFEHKIVYIDEVHDLVERSLTRELPFTIPMAAKLKLIKDCSNSWREYAESCFYTIHESLAIQIEDLISQQFNRFDGLTDSVIAIVGREVDAAKKETLERITWLIELENLPYTQNTHYFSSYRGKYLAKFKKERKRSKNEDNQPLQEDVQNALSALAKIGFQSLADEDLQKLNPADKYEPEMILMAEVRAYLQIAYKRIIDDVPRVIDCDYLRSIGGRIQAALISGLGLDSSDAFQRATSYLCEDPSVVAKRDDLTRQKEKLEKIVRKLFNFAHD